MRRPSATFPAVGLLLASLCLPALAALPPGLALVARDEDGWQLVANDRDGRMARFPTLSEPRTPAFSAARGVVAYVAANGEVRELDLASRADRLLLRPDAEVAYTQPAYSPDGARLYLVVLRKGSSVDTDMVVIDPAAPAARPETLEQRSAQFEPHPSADGRRLAYSSVSCTMECGRIIQEIWFRDLVTGEATQATLLNAVSRQPALAADGALYFASNAAGNYHIYRQAGPGETPQALTRGEVTDESPVVLDGVLHFIRRQRDGVHLMRWTGSGAERVPLPNEFLDLKDLRLAAGFPGA